MPYTTYDSQTTEERAEIIRQTLQCIDIIASKYPSTELFTKLTTFDKRIGWVDAVEAGKLENAIANPIDGPNGEIVKLLGHLIVNPSKKTFQNDLLTRSYVYSDQDPGAVNHNRRRTVEFLKHLNTISKQTMEMYRNRGTTSIGHAQARESLILLVGDRGVGKTFFQNHLLATHSRRFDKEKTIWIRVNLVDDFGDNYDLTHWMYAQAAKIILRYYALGSQLIDNPSTKTPIDVTSFVVSSMAEKLFLDEDSRKEYKEQFHYLHDMYVRNTTDEPISPRNISKRLGLTIWRSALDAGYSFIVVFDGLDRLESCVTSHEKFTNLLLGAKRFFMQDDLPAACICIACRHNSAEVLASGNALPFANAPIKRYRVGHVPVEKILRQRVRSIDATKPQWFIGEERQRSLASYLISFTGEFPGFSIFESNARAAMQGVQLRYHEFVIHSHKHHPYKLLESFIKMGWLYPPKHYSYCLSDDKAMPFSPISKGRSNDNRLMISIFAYPYYEWQTNAKHAPSFSYILLGLRILQFVLISKQLVAKKRARDTITVDVLAQLLEECFDYPGGVVRCQIREFAEFELITARRDIAVPSAKPFGNSRLSITKKSEEIVNNYVYDIAYLGLCAMRVPMPVKAFSRDVNERTPPIFIARAYEERPGGSRNHSLAKWVSMKAINSLNLFKLLVCVDEEQRGILTGRRKDILAKHVYPLSYIQPLIDSFLSETPRLDQYKGHVVEQLRHMLDGYISQASLEHADAVSLVLNEVRSYSSFWQD